MRSGFRTRRVGSTAREVAAEEERGGEENEVECGSRLNLVKD